MGDCVWLCLVVLLTWLVWVCVLYWLGAFACWFVLVGCLWFVNSVGLQFFAVLITCGGLIML